MTQMNEKQNERTMIVEIYGQSYPIKGKVDSEFIKQVAEYVDDNMKEIGANMSAPFAIHKIAVIAAMNIAAEYLKISEDINTVNDKSRQLIQLIEEKISS